jgi:replicative DNA helicase
MTALHAVAYGPPDDTGSEDLTANPETAPEALTICALMWSRLDSENHRIASVLIPADFSEPLYRQLYSIVQELILASAPHDPASVLDVLVRSGSAGHKGALLRRALTDVTTANACGASAADYAGMVMSESYRRGFHNAGAAITQMAEEAPEDQLFGRLVEIGRAQRAATDRLNRFRNGEVE